MLLLLLWLWSRAFNRARTTRHTSVYFIHYIFDSYWLFRKVADAITKVYYTTNQTNPKYDIVYLPGYC